MKLYLIYLLWVLIFYNALKQSTATPIYRRERSIFVTRKVSKPSAFGPVKTVTRPASYSTFTSDTSDTKLSKVFKRAVPVYNGDDTTEDLRDNFDFKSFLLKDISRKFNVTNDSNVNEGLDSSQRESNQTISTETNSATTQNPEMISLFPNPISRSNALQLLDMLNNNSFVEVSSEYNLTSDANITSESEVVLSELLSENDYSVEMTDSTATESALSSMETEYLPQKTEKGFQWPIQKVFKTNGVTKYTHNQSSLGSKVLKDDPNVFSAIEPSVSKSRKINLSTNLSKEIELDKIPIYLPMSSVYLGYRNSNSTSFPNSEGHDANNTTIISPAGKKTVPLNQNHKTNKSGILETISKWYIFSNPSVNYYVGMVVMMISCTIMAVCKLSVVRQARLCWMIRHLMKHHRNTTSVDRTTQTPLTAMYTADEEVEFRSYENSDRTPLIY